MVKKTKKAKSVLTDVRPVPSSLPSDDSTEPNITKGKHGDDFFSSGRSQKW